MTIQCRLTALTLCMIILACGDRVSSAQVVVHPEPALGPLDNPLKGWCPYTDAGPIRLPYSLVFLYAPWNELEPTEGHFEFDKWERTAWSVPEAEGKHVILRIYIDYPSRPSGLPIWLKDHVKLTRYEDHGGGLSPDYDDPRMLAAMERLIFAMGKRYNQHARVAFLQLGLLRTWQPGPFELESHVAVKTNPGRYKLALGIIDPWTDGPAVRLANTLPTHDGWTVLSSVTVGPAR